MKANTGAWRIYRWWGAWAIYLWAVHKHYNEVGDG